MAYYQNPPAKIPDDTLYSVSNGDFLRAMKNKSRSKDALQQKKAMNQTSCFYKPVKQVDETL